MFCLELCNCIRDFWTESKIEYYLILHYMYVTDTMKYITSYTSAPILFMNIWKRYAMKRKSKPIGMKILHIIYIYILIEKRLNIRHIVSFDLKNHNVYMFPCSTGELLNRKLFENLKFRVT